MAGQGTEIIATDYNAIQSKISNVLGVGSQDFGYGQPIASAQVARTTRITVNQWNNLRNDLLAARQHQTGLNESANLTIPTTNTTIKEADRQTYNTFADIIVTNRLVTPPPTQASLENAQEISRATPWNSTLRHTITFTFASVDDARYFFNAGGNIQFTSSFSDYTSGLSLLVNQSWATLLTNMGTISFNAYSVTRTGTGTAQAIGFYNLTDQNQLVFTKNVEAGNQYTPNQYDLYARKVGAQVIFTPTWSYVSLGAGSSIEPADGRLISTAKIYRPSGVNVSVLAPGSTATPII
jgi:hypothetical protein